MPEYTPLSQGGALSKGTAFLRSFSVRLRRWLRWHRRSLGAALISFGALMLVFDVSGSGQSVVVANRDLAPGTILTAADLRVDAFPANLVPDNAILESDVAEGEVLISHLARGQAVSKLNLLDGLAGDGDVLVPVPLTDNALTTLIHPGDRVSIYQVTTGIAPVLLAEEVQVVTVLSGDGSGLWSRETPATLIVSTDSDTAAILATSTAGSISVTIGPR